MAEKRDREQKALRLFRTGMGSEGCYWVEADTRNKGRGQEQGRGLART